MRMSELLHNKTILFWALQAAGWSGWAVSYYLGIMVWSTPPEGYEFYLPLVSLIGIGFTLLLRHLYRRTWQQHLAWRGLAMLGGSYLAALAWMGLRATLFQLMFPDEQLGKPDMAWYNYFSGTVSAFWVMRCGACCTSASSTTCWFRQTKSACSRRCPQPSRRS
jgi:hypothetical protein